MSQIAKILDRLLTGKRIIVTDVRRSGKTDIAPMLLVKSVNPETAAVQCENHGTLCRILEADSVEIDVEIRSVFVSWASDKQSNIVSRTFTVLNTNPVTDRYRPYANSDELAEWYAADEQINAPESRAAVHEPRQTTNVPTDEQITRAYETR